MRRIRSLREFFSQSIGDFAARRLGVPVLFAIGISAVGSTIYFTLGLVASDALGLTPLVYLLAAGFMALTLVSYMEGNALHPERGGASTFARHAFDELWSFIAGWAILLDYLIVMALAGSAIAHYLAAFFGFADKPLAEYVVAAIAIAFVAWLNIRGISVDRLGVVLRLAALNLIALIALVCIGAVLFFNPATILDSISLGSTPKLSGLLYGTIIATVALTGIEVSSGLASEVRLHQQHVRRFVIVFVGVIVFGFFSVATIGLMAVPVHGQTTDLATRFLQAPLLGVVSAYHPSLLAQLSRYAIGVVGALVLVQAINANMLGLSRLSYSLATNQQVPGALCRLHSRRSTPYVAIIVAAVIAFVLVVVFSMRFLAGLFAFGAMLAFAIAHVAVIVLRYREPAAKRPFKVPFSIRFRGGSIPLPSALGAVLAILAWASVVIFHSGARVAGLVWMLGGIALYVAYRRAVGWPVTKRFQVGEAALQELPEAEYGSILVPVFGARLDDDIMQTAGRLAAERAGESETDGGPMIEAIYVVGVPMSLPLDARLPEEQIQNARDALKRAKDVGEEYEKVHVSTATVRARSPGEAIVDQARRRGVEAIVLAAEEPTGIGGGAVFGGRGSSRERSIGEITRYVVNKAPCRVFLTAAPQGETSGGDGGYR